MKTLILVRHGQAEAINKKGDFNRELTLQGKTEVAQTARKLIPYVSGNTLMIASDATRTLQTVLIIAKQLNIPENNLEKEHFIFQTTGSTLLLHITTIHDSYDTLILTGHNPSISELVLLLTGHPVQPLLPAEACIVQAEIEHWKGIPGRWPYLQILPANSSSG
ncbi:MAG: histidine phosphatase family protein [Bacteroidia bacterium]|nr:histidine phosphatase family protein [Bacteroidia bacterium]MCZ2277472.1 histidine phosphatase family protein [Bacteroidia bacterium]